MNQEIHYVPLVHLPVTASLKKLGTPSPNQIIHRTYTT